MLLSFGAPISGGTSYTLDPALAQGLYEATGTVIEESGPTKADVYEAAQATGLTPSMVLDAIYAPTIESTSTARDEVVIDGDDSILAAIQRSGPRALTFLEKYQNQITAGIVLTVAGVVGWKIWKGRKKKRGLSGHHRRRRG